MKHTTHPAEPGPTFGMDALLRDWGAERRAAAHDADELVRMLHSAVDERVHARDESEASS